MQTSRRLTSCPSQPWTNRSKSGPSSTSPSARDWEHPKTRKKGHDPNGSRFLGLSLTKHENFPWVSFLRRGLSKSSCWELTEDLQRSDVESKEFANASAVVFYRINGWWIRLQSWGSLRLSGHRGSMPKGSVRTFVVDGCYYLHRPAWMMMGCQLLSNHADYPGDYCLPSHSNIFQLQMYGTFICDAVHIARSCTC